MLLKFFIVVFCCGQAFGKTFEKLSRDDQLIDDRRDEATDDTDDDSRPVDSGTVSTILIRIRSLTR